MATIGPLTLADYLEKLPGTSFRRLYQQPSTTLAVFRCRLLPSLAKTFVRWLLYFEGPMTLDYINARLKPDADSQKKKDQALSALRTLHIIQGTQEISLTANFKKSFRMALEGSGNHNSFGVPSEIDPPQGIDEAFLDRYARRKWEDILYFVVNSVPQASYGHDANGPKASVKDLLLRGGLVVRRSELSSGVGITKTGFTFLLQEANAQVWTLLLQWLEAVERSNVDSSIDSVDMLSFLFMLSTLQLGRAYDTNALTEARRNMLPSLVDFGLVFIPSNHRSEQYFPTRLATTLTSTASAMQASGPGAVAVNGVASSGGGLPGFGSASRGTIILETNFRLYAYTSSDLQIAIMGLFAKLSIRFPGMLSAKITRDSIRRAISYGITADQVISYLAANAHDQMRKQAAQDNVPVLPPTVVDQIRLWQLENERMKANRGFLFKEFDSMKEYELTAQYAESIGVLVWRSDKTQTFFVTKHEQLGGFLKTLAKKKAEKAEKAA